MKIEKNSPIWHQLQIAKKTLKMTDIAVIMFGGMSKQEAIDLLNKHK